MAQGALTAGTTVPRKRAMFGLLDADGWAWATAKAIAWLTLIILILGYIPDRAYYLTVSRTVDLGVLVWSPINLCPPENKTLPCPAPVGALVPWDASPAELDLPAARTDGTVVQVGSRLLYVGGTDGTTPQASVYVAKTVGTGNFDTWAPGPDLPAPRTDAAVAFVAGSIYVMGGKGADGAPTTTTYVLTPDGTTGDLGQWKTAPDALTLPEARSGAAAVSTADGMLLIGGSDANGPVGTTYKSLFDKQGVLQKWAAEQPLKTPQTDATAALVGDFVWLYGGSDATGPVALVQRGTVDKPAAAGFPANPNAGKVTAWTTDPAWDLPGKRTNGADWAVNGALYVAGGSDGTALHNEVYWSTPTNDGAITEWKHLAVSDLPVASAGGAPVVSGPSAIIVGGTTETGVTAGSIRANNAPQAPFFRLGLVGATVPGLTIQGEIGQQLGYLNAAGAGTLDFIILLLIGWAFANKTRARELIARVLRRH
jgi:Kelch motif